MSAGQAKPRAGNGVSFGVLFLISVLSFAILLVLKAPDPLTVDARDLHIHTDDAMRLTQVRDFLEGQGWYDLRQYRLGADDAAPMHWSRVIDAPLALLTLAFEPFGGRDRALLAAATVWPLIGAFLHILVSLAIGARLAGMRGLVCVGLIVLTYLLLYGQQLHPGRVDYHGQQVILMLTMSLLLISGAGRAWRPALAGLVACLSLSIGVAYVPYILVAGAAVAGRWILDGREARTEAAAFFCSLALCAPLAMLLTVPPDQWAAGWCDALSIVYALGLFVGGGIAGVAVIALPADAARGSRLAAIGVAALAALASTVALSPGCLAGPYALVDPVTREWLDNRGEVLGLSWALSQEAGIYVHRVTLWPLVGLAGLGLGALTAPEGRRHAWVLLLALAFTGWLISLDQLRGVRMTLPFTVLGAGYLLAWIVSLQGFARILKPVAVVALFFTQTPYAGALFDTTAGAADEDPGRGLVRLLRQCTFPEQMAPLAELPRGRVASSIDLGAFVLLRTPHWVLASPHHRNYAGNGAAVRMVTADPDTTYRILEDWNIDYVVTCEGWPTNIGASWLSGDEPPAWLQPLPSVEPLRIYKFVER